MTSYMPGAFPSSRAGLQSAAGRAAGSKSQWGAGGAPSTSGGTRAGLGTSAGAAAGKGPRPMTSNKAAGFSSRGRPATATIAAFDPFRVSNRVATEQKSEQSPEEQVRDAEKAIFQLLQESALATDEGRESLGLAKAKEAGKKERQLLKQRESLGLMESVNLDLTYCVLVNLAYQYQMNRMPQEAINTYTVVVKNKTFNQSGRLRVNIGNIYLEMGKYQQAVKMYRMALDQLSGTNKEMRLKILRNMGSAFVLGNMYQDAITSYETILETQPDHQTAFNALVCYYAWGDKEKMTQMFQRLISIPLPMIESSDELPTIDEVSFTEQDGLRILAIQKRKAIERQVLLAGKLLANSLEPSDGTSAYDGLIEAVRASPCADVAIELEIAKAGYFLHKRQFSSAIETLKTFERKESQLSASIASTNLSFLYYLEGELELAEKHATKALENDRYNARAHCNRGNCAYAVGDYERAREYFAEAINIDALCGEATFNLGLTCKMLKQYPKALSVFEKLHTILRNRPTVVWHIADIHERLGHLPQAIEWYSVLTSLVPTDPRVLAKLGDLFQSDGDKAQAYHFYSESYRFHPSDINVIAWLGSYYVDCEVYEQAMTYFERASIVDPTEIKWPLMAASCLRRCGNYQQAFDGYKRINRRWPNNVECIRYIVRIASDIGSLELNEWQQKLSKVERRQSAGDASATSQGKPAESPSGSRDSLPGRNAQNLKAERYNGSLLVHEGKMAGFSVSNLGSGAPEVDYDVQELLP